MANTVELKKDGLYLDGEKFFLISGDFHYFRTVREGWKRRLELMKDFGLTAVTTYVPWNLHEPKRGEYCFEGICDLEYFLQLSQECGLKVLLRCSPYLCGEFEMGGLPSWLLQDRTLCLRSSDKAYLDPLDEYNKVLCDKIRPYLYTNGGPIILVGLENEYGSFGDDLDYLKHLCDFYTNEKIDVPFVSANGVDNFKYINGTLPNNWNGIDTGAHISVLPQLDKLKEFQPDKPTMFGEAWTGPIQFWGRSFKKTDGQVGEVIAEFITGALKKEAVINFYMFCGGTNFAFTSGALCDVGSVGYNALMTSYDYNAPISEEGTPTEKYFLMRDALDEFLGKEKRPHVAPLHEVQEITNVKLTESAALFENREAVVTNTRKANRTICMEDMQQDYGYICYTSQIRHTDDRPRHVIIDGLADRATVYVDGKYIGTQLRDAEQNDISFVTKEGGSELTILVENMGRINYGYNMYDRKGILGAVHFKIENPDGSFLYNYANCMRYTIESMPMKNLENLKYKDEVKMTDMPTFYRAKFNAKAGVDTFLDMKGWTKGFVVINGFNLGRYWKIGPQRTLYVPGEILKEENVIEIFEVNRPKADFTVDFIDHALLCEETESDIRTADFQLL